MANLRDIKNRITSVESTRQVTRTMEMVSTAKIRKAQENIEHARPYALAMAEMLGNVTKAASSVQHPLLAVREDKKKVTIIAITSDRGLAGGFNSNIIHMAEKYMREQQAAGAEVDLIAVGKKINSYLAYRGIKPALSVQGHTANPTIADAKAIADRSFCQLFFFAAVGRT